MKIADSTASKTSIFWGIPFLLFLVLQALGFDGLYGQDSYEYLRYAEAIQVYLTEGTHPNSFYWPVLYPLIGSLLGFVLGSPALGLHFLSCLSTAIACVYLFKTLQLLYPQNGNSNFYYIFTFGLLSPYFLKSGLVAMSDMMGAMFIILVYYHFLKSQLKQSSLSNVFLLATCALMTRYATLVIIFPVIIFALYYVIKRRALKDLIIGGLLSILVCIPFMILQWDELLGGASNSYFNAWSPSYYLKSTYHYIDGLLSYPFPNLIFVSSVFVHPGFIFLGFLLTALTLKNYKVLLSFPQNLLAFSIIIYLLFLAGIPFQNIRVLGLIFPIVLLFFYPAFRTLIAFKWLQNILHF